MHDLCKQCGAAAMIQVTTGRIPTVRVNCENYEVCGMQTPWIRKTAALDTLAKIKAEAWRRWDRKAS